MKRDPDKLIPTIIGMNNPHSDDPRAALLPTPRGSAGWRLWRMVNNATDASRALYRRSFCFLNLVEARDWSPRLAREGARRFWEDLPQGRSLRVRAPHGRTSVVVLGRSAAEALGLGVPDARPVSVVHLPGGDAWLIPHPSGRCLWYNSRANREETGRLLGRLAGLPVRGE